MTAHTPIRTPTDSQADELDRMQEGCDLCGAHPVRTELDGDQLCQPCADKWARNEQPGFEDDLVPLDHPVMREAIARWKLLSDDQLKALSKGLRRFVREERRVGGVR